MSTPRDGFWLRIIYVVSAVLSGAVAFLILGPRPEGTAGALDVSALPTVNASFNALTTLLLITAVVLVKAGRVEAHRKVMLAAFASSAAFLVSYVIYHWFKAGPKLYTGEHRGLYLGILLSHIVLAVVVLPMQLVTLYRGWMDQREKHRRLARVTFPLWLYVSVTGVVIYVMLY
jgi:putative membrane protein